MINTSGDIPILPMNPLKPLLRTTMFEIFIDFFTEELSKQLFN